MIERLPSYFQRNYEELVNDLYYFMEGENDTYDLGEIIHFTKKWRKKPIDSIRTFKQYHKGFLAHTGKAIGEETIDKKEYNRYFWEGIHSHLQKQIEERLAVLDPNLNTSIPFETKQVVAAVKAIYPKDRFDRHLESMDIKSGKGYRPSHILSESEEDEDEESDESEEPRKRYTQKPVHIPFPPKPLSRTENLFSKKQEKNDIAKLTEQMNQLKLYLMQKESGKQTAAETSQNQIGNFDFNPKTPHFNNSPSQFNPSPSPFNSPLQRLGKPPSFPNSQFPHPPPQVVNASCNQQPMRDPPPHVSQNSLSDIPKGTKAKEWGGNVREKDQSEVKSQRCKMA